MPLVELFINATKDDMDMALKAVSKLNERMNNYSHRFHLVIHLLNTSFASNYSKARALELNVESTPFFLVDCGKEKFTGVMAEYEWLVEDYENRIHRASKTYVEADITLDVKNYYLIEENNTFKVLYSIFWNTTESETITAEVIAFLVYKSKTIYIKSLEKNYTIPNLVCYIAKNKNATLQPNIWNNFTENLIAPEDATIDDLNVIIAVRAGPRAYIVQTVCLTCPPKAPDTKAPRVIHVYTVPKNPLYNQTVKLYMVINETGSGVDLKRSKVSYYLPGIEEKKSDIIHVANITYMAEIPAARSGGIVDVKIKIYDMAGNYVQEDYSYYVKPKQEHHMENLAMIIIGIILIAIIAQTLKFKRK